MPGYHSPTQTRKGIPNKTTAATRQRIEESGDPVGFLISVMNGKPLPILDPEGNETGEYDLPTVDHRLSAARDLLRKLVPDLKAVEISGGPDGQPVVFKVESAFAPPNSASVGEVTPPRLQESAETPLSVVHEIGEAVAVEIMDDD